MTAAEFQRIIMPLTELEEYLLLQLRYAWAVGHEADAAVMTHAATLAGKARAEAQALMHETMCK